MSDTQPFSGAHEGSVTIVACATIATAHYGIAFTTAMANSDVLLLPLTIVAYNTVRALLLLLQMPCYH